MGQPKDRTLRHVGSTLETRWDVGLATPIKTPNADATDAEKIAHLVDRSVETQKKLARLDQGIADARRDAEVGLQRLREELHEHVAHELARTRDAYLSVRMTGVALVVLGSILATIGGFLD